MHEKSFGNCLDRRLVLMDEICRLGCTLAAPPLDNADVCELNRELAANSYRWLFERSDRSATLTIPLPHLQPAMLQSGPLEIANEPRSELYKHSRPSRWFQTAEPPPLPVARWWGEHDEPYQLFADTDASVRHLLIP